MLKGWLEQVRKAELKRSTVRLGRGVSTVASHHASTILISTRSPLISSKTEKTERVGRTIWSGSVAFTDLGSGASYFARGGDFLGPDSFLVAAAAARDRVLLPPICSRVQQVELEGRHHSTNSTLHARDKS